MMQSIRNYLELCRIQYAGFGILSVVGALTVVGDQLTFAEFVPLFAVHVLTIAWSFAHNDYCDYEIDRHGKDLGRRVIVRGDISRQAALRFAAAIFGLTFLITVSNWPGLLPVGLLLGTAGLIVSYNLISKRYAGTDVLFATAGTLFCVLGAVAVLPDYDIRLVPALTWIVVGISFLDLLNFNAVLGGLKDVVSDRDQGCVTLAGKFTQVDDNSLMTIAPVFKFFTLLGSLMMVGLVFLPFIAFDYTLATWQMWSMIVLGAITIFYTFRFVNLRHFNRDVIAEIAGKREFASNLLRLCMLVTWIGLHWTFYLIAIGGSILVFFNVVIYGHPFRAPAEF